MNEYIDALLSLDFEELTALVDQVINNPLANVQAALLFLIAIVVLTLVAIALVVLFIGFGDDEDEEDERAPVEQAAPAVAAPTRRREPLPPPPPLTPEERRWRWAKAIVVTVISVLAAWVLTGLTTSSDTMCMSCHGSNMPHAERLIEESTIDPHKSTQCVLCHEPGGTFGTLTYNVPDRAVHFGLAMALPERAVGYGTPIRSSACASCHSDSLEGVVTVEDRGVRVSHKEPLDAGATCVDCHELQVSTGAVGSWTVGMDSCLRCHDNQQASAECDDCHTKDIAYAMHVDRAATPKRLITEKRCGSCHELAKCNACHGIEMPHTPQFINLEHPRAATIDIWYNEGQTCKKCHTDRHMPCLKCHVRPNPGHPPDSWPYIHGARPAAGAEAACDSCHGYLARINGRNFCGVCHAEYARQFTNQ